MRYDLSEVKRAELLPRGDLWRYAPLLPLASDQVRPRGEGGTPLLRAERLALGVRTLYVKDEGRNPTGTFKARGMAVAVPMARALGAKRVVVPTAGNAGAALALYAAVHGLEANVFMAPDAPAEARREALAYGARVVRVEGDISDAGRLAQREAESTGAFNLATFREPFRVEGKKTMLLELWDALGGMPDWILFPTGGGTGVAGMWKALGELRDLGWYEGPWPRIGVVQAAGCAPLVKAWNEGKERADPWRVPRTAAAGLRVPATLGDRLVLRALRETRGTAIAVPDGAMAHAMKDLATREGISACWEGAATLAGLRVLVAEGMVTSEDRVVLVNTGSAREGPLSPSSETVRKGKRVPETPRRLRDDRREDGRLPRSRGEAGAPISPPFSDPPGRPRVRFLRESELLAENVAAANAKCIITTNDAPPRHRMGRLTSAVGTAAIRAWGIAWRSTSWPPTTP